MYGQGLPIVTVSDLYMPTDGSYLRVSTYGRGVWETCFSSLGGVAACEAEAETRSKCLHASATAPASGSATLPSTSVTLRQEKRQAFERDREVDAFELYLGRHDERSR